MKYYIIAGEASGDKLASKVIASLKKINPNIEFSSDFIIGYPEESDDDFKYTMKLIEKVGFINSYSFIFSPRPGTVAADLELVDKKKSKERFFVIDLLVADISLVVTKRSEFNSMLKTVDYDLSEFNKKLLSQNESSYQKIIN